MEHVSIIAQLKKKKPTDIHGTIIIRAFYCRRPVKAISTGFKVQQIHWNAQQRCVVSTAPNASLINACVKKRIDAIGAELMKKELAGIAIDAGILTATLSKGSDLDFLAFAEKTIQEKTLADGKPYNPGSVRRYRVDKDKLASFRKKISFHDITPEFLEKYKNWLLNEYRQENGQPLNANSIWKSITFIRMVWNYAIKKKLVSRDSYPFKNFQIGNYKTNPEKIRYLKLDQVDKIEKCLLEHTQTMSLITQQVGWRFLFMCVSGLRISDARLFNEEYLKDSALNFIPEKTKRNGNNATVHLVSERQQRYLQKTLQAGFPKKSYGNTQKLFNDQLQFISAMAGLGIRITSHMARHTMGSFLVDGNVDEKAAKKILGVSTTEVLKTYMHLKDSKLLKETQKLAQII